MAYLKKIQRLTVEETKAPPRPLAPIIAQVADSLSQVSAPPDDAGVAKIDVHDAVSNVAWMYEKLRQAIDYQDEHLLRKNAIERILKRRLTPGITAEKVAEPLILELIRGRYLPNNALPVTMINRVAQVLNAYIHLWIQVPKQSEPRETERLFDWYLGLIAVHLSELMAPVERDEILSRLMFEVTHRDINFAEGEMDEASKNTQIYIAIERALLKSDTNIIRYRLFIRHYPEWKNPTPETIASLGKQLPNIRQAIDAQVFHPAGELLQRIMKKYSIIFWIFDDLTKQYGAEAAEKLTHPDDVEEDVKAAYAARQKTVRSKIGRNVFRSIVYVFLTKMLLTLIIELPVDRILAGAEPVNYLPLGINILFHPFVLLLIGITINVPGKKNMANVVEKVQDLIYRGNERNSLVKPRKPIRRSTIFIFLYRIVYSVIFMIVFGGIIAALSLIGFTPFSMFVFLLFLPIVSFFGIRVRLLAKELLVVDQRESIFTVLFDFFTLPILQVGRWIALRAPKVNVLIFFLDVIIEAPFKAFLEATEGFFGFLREKREEIY